MSDDAAQLRAESVSVDAVSEPRYRTIVADPPWAFDGGDALPFAPGLKVNGEQQQSVGPRDSYGRMATADLLALRPPVEDDAHLYLWTVNAFMVEAHEIAEPGATRQLALLGQRIARYCGDDRVRLSYEALYLNAIEWQGEAEDARARVRELEAEVERLREALRDLIWASTEFSGLAYYEVPMIVEEEFVSALDDARKVVGDA